MTIKSVIESTLLVTALIAVSVILASLTTGGMEQKLLRRMYILLSDHQARIGSIECFKNRVICLSEDKKHLFFIRKTASGYETRYFELKLFAKVSQVASATDGMKTSACVDSISLCFKPVRPYQPDTVLSLFDPEVDTAGKDEAALAQRWLTNIRPNLVNPTS